MTKRYTEYEKQDVLAILEENQDNIALTSRQLKIPERTIRDWRRKAYLRGDYLPEKIYRRRRQTEIPEKTRDQFQTLRDNLMSHVFSMAETLAIPDEFVNHRAVAISRLVDRVVKIDELLNRTLSDEAETLLVKYEYPDGTIHDEAPWDNPDYVDEETRAEWEEMLNHPDAPRNFRHSPHLRRLWEQRLLAKQAELEAREQQLAKASADMSPD